MGTISFRYTPFHSPLQCFRFGFFNYITFHWIHPSLHHAFGPLNGSSIHYIHWFSFPSLIPVPSIRSHLTNSKLPSIQYIHYTPSSLHSLLVSFSTFISLLFIVIDKINLITVIISIQFNHTIHSINWNEWGWMDAFPVLHSFVLTAFTEVKLNAWNEIMNE